MSLLLLFQDSGGGGPTNYSLTCDAGSYTYTGVAATFVAARGITADAGSYTYTGVANTLNIGRVLTANTGSYSYTGINNSTSFARSIAADAGSYNYTGQDATFLLGKGLIAEVGSYIYSGIAAVLSAVITSSKGGGPSAKYDKELIRRRKIQQGYLKDDEELLAIMIATLTRRKK